MNSSIKTQAVNQLKEIAKELKQLGAESKLFERPSSGQNFMHNHVWIHISGEGLEKHDQLVALLFKNSWSDKFSEKYLDDKLRSVYARYVQNPSDEMLAGCFKGIADEYESFGKEHLVIVPLANAVAEGCAFVLGEEAEKRKLIFRRVKQFYGARCGLSHGGKTAVLESEIKESEWIVWHVIVSLLAKTDNFQTQESLWEWIEEQKFN